MVIYYQNEISISGGLITVIINRLGDGAIIFFVCSIILYNDLYYIIGFFNQMSYSIALFMIACFTKSAQFPFMSWLPLAMTAPTPVSSLVHSSTLVTAGVYMLIRINIFLAEKFFGSIIMFLGLFTIGLGGLLAIFEVDLKKLIAFSTLSQLGLLIFILRFGELKICFFHLISHAIFKSFLFIIFGIFISIRFGEQDRRIIGLKFLNRNLFFLFVLFSCLNLIGFPLTLGFISKDLILEFFFMGDIYMLYLFFFLLFCCFTVCYSIKLFFNLINFIKIGNVTLENIELFDRKIVLLLLFFYIFIFGIFLEEIIIEDDLFSYYQDFKVVDLIIISFGIIIFYFLNNYYSYLFLLVDYF